MNENRVQFISTTSFTVLIPSVIFMKRVAPETPSFEFYLTSVELIHHCTQLLQGARRYLPAPRLVFSAAGKNLDAERF